MTNQTTQKNGNPFWNFLWLCLTIVLILVVILKFFVFQQVNVVGSSMNPNYADGELLMVNQINKQFERGQVVAIYADKNIAQRADYFTRFSAKFFLKRIIGLPKESIEIIDSNVIIYNSEHPQGSVLVENYISEDVKISEAKRSYYYPKTEIPDNHYFVMGDNRSNSTDSRSGTLGAIPTYSIFGIESLRFWPVNQFQIAEDVTYTFIPISEVLKARREKTLSINSEGVFDLRILRN